MHPRNAYSSDDEYLKALRDWFAGTVDPGPVEFDSNEVAAKFVGCDAPETDIQLAQLAARVNAKIRYMMADAMLAERSKP